MKYIHKNIRIGVQNYTKMLLCSLVFLFVWFSVASEARAQESSGLRVQPAIIEERVDPGFVYSSTLRATNLSPETKTFYIIKRNISRLSPTGSPIFAQEGEETGFEMADWIKVTQGSVIIGAGDTTEIPFSIEVPKNASPGGHFGGIFLSLTPERPKETGVGVGFQVGAIINLRISGDVFEEARMREFRTDRYIYSKPTVKFITKVENIGNVLIRPRGPLEITDFFGKKVAMLRMNDRGAAVLPKQERQFEVSWQGEGLVFGRYQALLGLVYGEDERKNISDTVSFWVLPLNIILPILGGLVAAVLAVLFGIRFHIRRKLRELNVASGITAGSRTGLLSRRHRSPSRLLFIAIALLLFTLLLLLLLFIFFA